MKEIIDELEELSYKLWQNYELMRILNVAIQDNMESNNELSVINLSEMIENQLKSITKELDTIPIKLYQHTQ